MGGAQGERSAKLHYYLVSRYTVPSNNSRYWVHRMAQRVRHVHHQYLEYMSQERIWKADL